MKNEKAFTEWDHELVPSSYGELTGKKRYYRVSYGAAYWHSTDPNQIHKACTVFVQFGNNLDFKIAKSRNEIKDKYPCHILDCDLKEVLRAIEKLKVRNA
ncbi:hypothetical protein AAGG74_14870 [Bacillus mexicanus]|uniref:hypothetical protein n=1 Tax=Bacillus mexicanus TaxID=2834415 RepID=UPI003D23AC50